MGLRSLFSRVNDGLCTATHLDQAVRGSKPQTTFFTSLAASGACGCSPQVGVLNDAV